MISVNCLKGKILIFIVLASEVSHECVLRFHVVGSIHTRQTMSLGVLVVVCRVDKKSR